MPNKTKQVPVLRVIGFHTNKYRGTYIDPLNGVIRGDSISHVAMQFMLPNTPQFWQLFDKHIATYTQIPYSQVLTYANTDTRILSEYVSFWPKTQIMKIASVESAMLNHQHDAFTSGLGSPMRYSPWALQRFGLKPLKETLAPRIPLLSKLFTYTVDMPPLLIVHETNAKALIKNNLKLSGMNEQAIEQQAEKTIADLRRLAELYRIWCGAYITEQNANHKLFVSSSSMKKLKFATLQAQDNYRDYLTKLKFNSKGILYTEFDLSNNEFIEVLEQFTSFGRQETDVIDIPLLDGFDIEAGLKLVKELAIDPEKYKYNLWTFNCATVVLRVCQEMVKNGDNKELKRCFDFPWYVRYLGLPVSPAMVLRQIAMAKEIIELNNNRPSISPPSLSTSEQGISKESDLHPCIENTRTLFTAGFSSQTAMNEPNATLAALKLSRKT